MMLSYSFLLQYSIIAYWPGCLLDLFTEADSHFWTHSSTIFRQAQLFAHIVFNQRNYTAIVRKQFPCYKTSMWGSNVSLNKLVLLKCLSNLFAYLLLLRPFGHRIKKITKLHFCEVSAQTLTIERAHDFSCVPQIIVVTPQSKFS